MHVNAVNCTGLLVAAMALLLSITPGVRADTSGSGDPDPHAAHRQLLKKPGIKVDHVAYSLPDVRLVNTDGEAVDIRRFLEGDRPLAVNFIFTTCTTICPVMTATMLQLQQYLGSEDIHPTYVSISIDPDYDSAAVMRDYAHRFNADWTFLTGSAEDINAVLKAFNAYRGNKVNHFPLTLMRAADDSKWTRIEGLTSANELARIWRETAL